MALPAPGGVAAQRQARHEDWYRANADHLARTLGRGGLYLYDIVVAVERAGLPAEIALLPAVESAFRPDARSPAAADGLWQFIALTARRFDLAQHMFVDERRHIRAATQAALRYLTELHARFDGDWLLALAAYNCGEGCIERSVRAARARGLAGRFEDLRLNEETAQYVPRLLALARVVREPQAFGLDLPPLPNAPRFAAVTIARDMDVAHAARLAGVTVAEFRLLNPQHKKPLIVAAAGAEVFVPAERAAAFAQALAAPDAPPASWTAVRVRRAGALTDIARRCRCDAAELARVNGIPAGHWVQAGSTLLVPRGANDADISDATVEQARLVTLPPASPRQVKVAKGETWDRLARRLKVPEDALRRANPGLRLRAGTLTLRIPRTPPPAAGGQQYF